MRQLRHLHGLIFRRWPPKRRQWLQAAFVEGNRNRKVANGARLVCSAHDLETRWINMTSDEVHQEP